jgi:phosphoribosyl 1,2-cyclic phosphodiesterase
MGDAPALAVRFWGVRGSIACPSPGYIGFGGNTSCVEIRVAGRILILDAGTGVRALGKLLQREGAKEAVILFSHTHWDHVNGFPFFEPAFEPDPAPVAFHEPAPAMNIPQAEVIALDSMRAASPGYTPEDLDVPAFMRKRNEVM